ncbi:MAG: hypothetical protein KGL39_01170 [Patescibacteria group bacterium]|nr:hypothetical protein [Patescibacteria group bacterium]
MILLIVPVALYATFGVYELLTVDAALKSYDSIAILLHYVATKTSVFIIALLINRYTGRMTAPLVAGTVMMVGDIAAIAVRLFTDYLAEMPSLPLLETAAHGLILIPSLIILSVHGPEQRRGVPLVSVVDTREESASETRQRLIAADQ